MKPSLDGLSWVKVRALAHELAIGETPGTLLAVARKELASNDVRHQMLGAFLAGQAPADAATASLALLHELAIPLASWEVQEAVAQAFDALCATTGYEVSLPVIDAWLAGEHPHARRAVSEGLRPWTSRKRSFFAKHPQEAISRLAALRRDPSEYVRHSAGNALRDISRAHPGLVASEVATWNLADPRERFTEARVRKRQ